MHTKDVDEDQQQEIEALFNTEGCPGCQRLPRSQDYLALDLGWDYNGNELTDELCQTCGMCPDCCHGHSDGDDEWFDD